LSYLRFAVIGLEFKELTKEFILDLQSRAETDDSYSVL